MFGHVEIKGVTAAVPRVVAQVPGHLAGLLRGRGPQAIELIKGRSSWATCLKCHFYITFLFRRSVSRHVKTYSSYRNVSHRLDVRWTLRVRVAISNFELEFQSSRVEKGHLTFPSCVLHACDREINSWRRKTFCAERRAQHQNKSVRVHSLD